MPQSSFDTVMDHFKKIYTHHAKTYHRMIAVEDVDNNLLPAMERVVQLSEKKILDLGSGTGRIPLLLHERVQQIIGLDLHWDMLIEQQRLRNQKSTNWDFLRGDMRDLPFPDRFFDVITAGWALGHFMGWYADDWRTQIERVIREMIRVVIPGGTVIIIETLSTGSLTPAAPTPDLARYYAWLENQWGFNRQQIQTDYQFRDLEEAAEQTAFFFGEELSQIVLENNWVRLPEWTGIWGKRTMA